MLTHKKLRLLRFTDPEHMLKKGSRFKKEKRIENSQKSTLLQLSSLPDRDDVTSVLQLDYLLYYNRNNLLISAVEAKISLC